VKYIELTNTTIHLLRITYPGLGHEFYPSSQWISSMDQYNSMSCQIFIYGLKLILGLGLHIPLPPPHPTFPLQVKVSTSSMECKTDLTSGFGHIMQIYRLENRRNTSSEERADKFHYIYLLSLIMRQSQH
jgi:hypothetical protein